MKLTAFTVFRFKRNMATQTMTSMSSMKSKKEGDISSVFASLSGGSHEPLPERFAKLKQDVVRGREAQLVTSWNKLLDRLRDENELVASKGPSIIPQINFSDIGKNDETFKKELRRRGAAVVRGVVPEQEARGFKEDVERYVKANPHTKAFPQHDPQVFELYWSPAQIQARSYPNLLEAQKFLASVWHASPETEISSTAQFAYADRVRIRKPGDKSFALGPHIDGGGVERWEENGYGRGRVYDKILSGHWEEYDPWDATGRVSAVSDLYDGAGACSMFRMFQGWLGMSWTKPGEGTLMVNPMIQLTSAYVMLRPFFNPKKPASEFEKPAEYLDKENWVLKEVQDSDFPGANSLGHSQELNAATHPHLDLDRTMVHVPEIKPGDFVVWHCDSKSFLDLMDLI
jgi:hypothetical protein